MASIEKRISKTGELSYRITACSGYDLKGRKVRHRKTFCPDPKLSEKQADKAAQKEAFLFEQELEQGYIPDDRQTFQEYAEYVLELKLRNGLKRSTYERYRTLLPKINEAIRTFRLRDIRPMHLNLLYAQLSEAGARTSASKAVAIRDVQTMLKERGMSKAEMSRRTGVCPQSIASICNRTPVVRRSAEKVAGELGCPYSALFSTIVDETPLSAKTVLEYHRLTCAILSQAEKEMLVPYNAAKKATPPRSRQKDVNYFQPAQICEILEALEDEPLKWQLVTHLLMVTGARRGEIAELKWSKFDLEHHRVKVDTTLLNSPEIGVYESTTKTGNQRYIPLPEETFRLLRRYQTSQKELQMMADNRWVQTEYVFTQEDGRPIRPDTITQWLSDFSRRKGLPHINPHAFRHTAASVLIAHGTDVVTVSKMLGHSKVSTTEDIYSHVIEESKQQASNVLAEVYFHRKQA